MQSNSRNPIVDSIKSNPALREALRNPDVAAYKDNCLHGAPGATDAIVKACIALESAVAPARTGDEAVALLGPFVCNNPRSATDTVRKVLLSMATDAALAEDWANCRHFVLAAVCLRTYLETGAVTASDDLRDIERSNWHLKRYLALQCSCRCFTPRFAASCAHPGCGARHEVGGVTLRFCSKCRITYYCSAEHQAAHWAEHKTQCKAKASSRAAKATAA